MDKIKSPPPALILGLLPLLLTALNPAWLYTPPGIDSWIYYGYFEHLPAYLQAFPDSYFGARLAWILPGYGLHQVFPPLIANALLHLGLWYVAVGAFYGALRSHLKSGPALTGALLLGLYGPFLGAVGWNYIDGAGMAYICLTFYCLSRGWFLGAGLSAAAMLHTNLFLGMMAPVFLLYWGIVAPGLSIKIGARALMQGLLGALGLTLAFALLTYALNGNFWFMGPSLRFAQDSSGFTLPPPGWLGGALHLALPFGLSLSSLIFVLWRGRAASRYALGMQAVFASHWGLALLLELSGRPALSLPAYSTYLIPVSFLALAAQVADLFEEAPPWPLLPGLLLPLLWPAYREGLQISPSLWAAGALFLALWSVLGWRWLAKSLRLALLGFLLGGIAYWGLYYQNFSNQVTRFDRAAEHRDLFWGVGEALAAIEAQTGAPHAPVWFASDSPDYPAFYAIAAALVPPYGFLSPDFPAIWSEEALYDGAWVVLLSDGGELFPAAERALNDRLWRVMELKPLKIEQGGLAFTMQFLRLGGCDVELDPPALYGEAQIFYPGPDLTAQRESLRVQAGCLLTPQEGPAHLELAAAFEQARGGDYADWLAAYDPQALVRAGVDYLLLTEAWLSLLDQASYDYVLHSGAYEVVQVWQFERVEGRYYLLRPVRD